MPAGPTIHNWVAGWKGKFLYLPAGADPLTGDKQEFHVESFGFDHMVATDDITNTGGGGAQDVIDTIESANGDVTFVYDSSIDPEVSPQVFKPRMKAWLFFQPDGNQNYFFYALITKISFRSGPKEGAVRVKCEFMSKGPITTPLTSQPVPAAST